MHDHGDRPLVGLLQEEARSCRIRGAVLGLGRIDAAELLGVGPVQGAVDREQVGDIAAVGIAGEVRGRLAGHRIHDQLIDPVHGRGLEGPVLNGIGRIVELGVRRRGYARAPAQAGRIGQGVRVRSITPDLGRRKGVGAAVEAYSRCRRAGSAV